MTEIRQDADAALRAARLRRVATWTLGSVLGIAFVGFIVLPLLARHFGERALTDVLGRPVAIERVRINPFALSLTAYGVAIAEPDAPAPAFSFATLYANLEAESIFRGGPVLRELRIDAPRLGLVRLEAGRYNWSDVIERLAAGPPSSDEPARFSVNNIRITGGHVAFDDRVAGVRHEISGLDFGVPFVSNLPVKVDLFVEPSLSAQVNRRPFALSGRAKPFSSDRETLLDITLDGFDFTPYVAYLPFEPGFSVAEGRISTRLALSFVQPPSAAPTLVIKGSLDLAGLRIEDREATPLLSIPSLALGLADVQPLAGVWHFDRLAISQPEVDLVRLADGQVNFQKLLPQAATAPQPDPAGTPPGPAGSDAAAPAFRVDHVHVAGGTLRFEDRAAAAPFRTRLEAIELDVRDFANAADSVATVALDFTSDAGEKVSVRDRVRLDPFELDGRLSVEGLVPARYAAYYADALPDGEIRSGHVDAAIQYRLKIADGTPALAVLAESLVLRDVALALREQETPLANIAQLGFKDVAVSVPDRSVRIGALESKGIALSAVRERDGSFDVLRLLGAPPPLRDGPPADDAPWSLALDRLALEDGSVRFEDRSAGTPVVMQAEAIRLGAEGLSNAPGAQIKVDLASQVNRTGRLAAQGAVAVEPLKGKLLLDLRGVDLAPLRAYVAEELNVEIARGNLTTRGTLEFARARDGTMEGGFRGDLGVADFASIDKLNATDFLRWRTLRVNGVDLQVAPFGLSVDEIGLTDFYTRLILDEQGRLNLREIQARPAATGPATAQADAPAEAIVPAPDPEPPPVSIGRIRISKGNIAFSDRFIRPNYDANLTGMEGDLVGLSSDVTTIAKLDLHGRIDDAAVVTVSGELNPFRQDRYLDIDASVKDFELTAISAYSGRYVGYGIEKGKLSADLNYRIEDRKLTATNRIFLDQFTFGDRIESPDALDLPVQFAVSLLENRKGEIDLNVPVSGTLDDPQFSVGALVIKALINLIGKAITAPFALLGSMFGDGEELSRVGFEPGRAVIEDAAAEKLATLAKALSDRPALKLEITGRADSASDPDGLKKVMLERSVKAAKLKDLVRRGEEAPSLDEIELEPTEYAKWLERVYRDADFDRPRNAIGFLKDLPVADMEALMLANTAVDAAAMQQLAQRRAQSVRTRLVDEGGVAPDRVFMRAPDVGAGKKGEEAPRSVEFSLK